MSDRQGLGRVLAGLEAQGCRIEQTKKGLIIFFPDGVHSTSVHWTPSDHRAMANFRATVRRYGCEWPLDGGKKSGH